MITDMKTMLATILDNNTLPDKKIHILKKYFNLKNLSRYNGNIMNVWNFLTFNL